MKEYLFVFSKECISGNPEYIKAICNMTTYKQEKAELNRLTYEKEFAQRTKISYDRDKNNLNRDTKNKELDHQLSLLNHDFTNTQRMNE